jgi:hypothetical protein
LKVEVAGRAEPSRKNEAASARCRQINMAIDAGTVIHPVPPCDRRTAFKRGELVDERWVVD